MEENIKRKDWDEIRPKNILQCTDIRYLVVTEDKRKNKKQKVSTGEF